MTAAPTDEVIVPALINVEFCAPLAAPIPMLLPWIVPRLVKLRPLFDCETAPISVVAPPITPPTPFVPLSALARMPS